MYCEKQLSGVLLDTEHEIKAKACKDLAHIQDSVILEALKRHLAVDTLDINALIDRCGRVTRVGVAGSTFYVDGVPVVWLGEPRAYNDRSTITLRFQHQYLGDH